jgi:hypothetical protein
MTFGRGTLIGDYRIDRELSRTRQAIVYLARHVALGREVQLKVLAPNQVFRGADQQFLHEAQVLDRLRHPGVARVFDCGALADGRPWFAIEHVVGPTLAEVIASGARIDIARVVVELASILEHAHAAGLAHRNLSAENVLWTAGGLVVVGWGNARATLASDLAADVHALGLVALQLLGGVMAFSSHALAMLANVSAAARFPRAPRAVTELVDRMLSRDVRVRPTMSQVRDGAADIVVGAMRPSSPALFHDQGDTTMFVTVGV